jgi:DNA-directed RNA polymerase subunit M/transcription elongation factor TFIIS
MDSKDAADQLREAAVKLDHLADAVEGGDDWRSEIDDVLAGVGVVLSRHYGPRKPAKKGEGGQWKMLAYLRVHLGEWVHGDELVHIARIKTFGRRLRQLRVEHGWRLEEEDGYYRLISNVPDVHAAAKWKVANSIKRSGGSAKKRVGAFLEANVGQIVNRDQLDYVADKVKEGTRRARELRDEDGWPIDTRVDDPTLGISEYRLLSTDPADRRDPRQRLYPEKLRARIFERDAYTCQKCKRDKGKAEAAGDTRFYLEVHHQTALAEELDALTQDELNDESNLITYCHSCHHDETAEFQRRRRAERRGS